MKRINTAELEVVCQSDIEPVVFRRFIAGYICENVDKAPYKYTTEIGEMYPNYGHWFKEKVVPELLSGEKNRELMLLLASEGIVAGFAILKKTKEEKKICTFRISEGWRNGGAGKKLMEECIRFLDNEKPLITVSDKCKVSFENLFNQFGFEETQRLKDLYVVGSTEYVFNGELKIEK